MCVCAIVQLRTTTQYLDANAYVTLRWLDLGLDIESQQRELRGLADGAIRLCARELRRHAGSRARLRQRHDELNAMAFPLANWQNVMQQEI